MKRPHPFRFIKRSSSKGPVYYVIYDDDPSKPKATGVLINKKDRTESYEPAGHDDAVAWAYANMENIKRYSYITFRQFAESFFDPDTCTWTQRQYVRHRRKGKDSEPFNAGYLQGHRGRINNYIMSRWGAVPLNLITTKSFDEWLLQLDSVRTGLPLAPASLDKILTTMRIILDEAQYQGYIDDNPARKISPFGFDSGREIEPFTIAEINKLFPKTEDEALRIWLTREWYAYFLMQWTCGLRPGEASAFMLIDWLRDHHGAVISRAIESSTRRVKGLKTEKKGLTVKPVVFSDRLEELLSALSFTHKEDELLFQVNGKAIRTETSNKHFKASVKRAKVDLRQRTQYCLKHTWYTELLKRIPEKEVEKMAAHRKKRHEYDHRKGIDFLRAAQPLREVINELSA